MSHVEYVGSELEIFEAATVWKSYLRKQIAPFLGPRVLEVGAGIGSTTRFLCSGAHERWTCLEPDRTMAGRIAAEIASGSLPPCCAAVAGSLATYRQETGGAATFDAVLYIDVLEHIEDDAEEVRRATGVLAPGGRLIVLAPAHQWLYSPFDAAIGHYRRYGRADLRALTTGDLRLVMMRSLDAAGLLASAGNRFLLRDSHPTPMQIRLWDRVLVRTSRAVDPLFGFSVGKSILAVWERVGPGCSGTAT